MQSARREVRRGAGGVMAVQAGSWVWVCVAGKEGGKVAGTAGRPGSAHSSGKRIASSVVGS